MLAIKNTYKSNVTRNNLTKTEFDGLQKFLNTFTKKRGPAKSQPSFR